MIKLTNIDEAGNILGPIYFYRITLLRVDKNYHEPLTLVSGGSETSHQFFVKETMDEVLEILNGRRQ